jgi:plasmid segregation protein ParM
MDSFVSGLSEHTVQPPLATEAIEWGGRHWTLTENRIPYMRDKTKDDRFFILTLFAIARELRVSEEQPYEIDICLAVGLPPEHFSILKDRFAEYFQRGAVRFKYNSIPVFIEIHQVFVYPQAYAAVVAKPRLLMSMPRLFIIDIGGITTDILLLRNGKPDLQFCRSLEVGAIAMNNDIIGKVSTEHGILIEDDHIASVIQGQETILPEPVIQTIWESTRCHIDLILNKLRELQVDLRSTQAIFIGGGAVLFRQNIEGSPMVAKADFIADPKANAIGYSTLAASQLRKLSLKGMGNENA